MTLKPAFSCPFLVLSLLVPFVAGAQAVSEDDAKQTILRYLEAQRQGDTHTMRSLIAGDLLEKKRTSLSNPTYPAYLSKTLAEAQFSIGRTEQIGPASILVQASTTYRPGDTIGKHYVLQPKSEDGMESGALLIHDEYDPEFR